MALFCRFYELYLKRPMKIMHPFVRSLAVGVVALTLTALATESFAASSTPLIARVIRLKGRARYSSDRSTWHTLKQGDLLMPGSLIQTAEKSSVDLRLGEEGAGAF